MKRTFLVLFLLSALCSAYAQTITIHVSGHVTYDDGTPVEGTPVAIFTDSLMGFFYYNEVPTDPDGFYEDWIEVPATLTQGTLFVTVWDCPWGPGGANLQLLSWFPNHTDLVADFICPSQPLCSVTIEAQPNPNGVTTLEAQAQGTPPYTYLWSNGYVSPSIAVQGSGTWCVTVTDSIDCVATACHTIGTDSSDCGLQLDVLPDVIIANAWGAEPITYLWSDGSTEPVLMPNGQGTYCLTITDATGCSAEACTWFTPGIGNDSCMVQIEVVQNGTWLDATICGCASQVSFQWSTGDTTQAIPIDTSLSQYCVTITSPGCVATDCIDLDALNCGVTIAAQPGANVMTAIATGVPPFSYLWNTGETTATIQLDSPGVYCVTVTDALGCATTDCTYWGTPGPCTVLAQLDTIWGSDSVYLWASASSGQPPYTFQWIAPDGTVYAGVDVVTDQEGEWCVVMTDAAGCSALDCITPFTDGCTAEIYPDPDCISLFAWSTGPLPHSYQWSTGNTEAVIFPLFADEYCVTVTDAEGCVAETCVWFDPAGCSDTCWVDIEVVQNGTWLTADVGGSPGLTSFEWSNGATAQSIPIDPNQSSYCVTITTPTGCVATDCIDLMDCSVEIFPMPNAFGLYADASGIPPFSYQWNTGTTEDVIFIDGPGTYCVTVTDAVGCTTTDCTTWGTPEPCVVMAQLDTIWGSDSVQLWAWTAGGLPPYTILWIGPDSTVYEDWGVVTNQPGEWCVVMTDAAGCQATDCITPFSDPCTAEIMADPQCHTLFAWSTGPLPHSYQWSTGSNYAVIFPLSAGEYCVTVTDAEGCVADTCIWFDPAGCSDTCWVDIEVVQNGTWLTADVGGSPGLTSFAWSNGATTPSIPIDLNQSSYCVTITTPTGCVATDCIDLMGCSVEILMTPNTNGLFAAASGIPPFSYQWNTGATEDVIFPDEPGTYCVTVTDALGCTAEACMELFPPEPCHVSLTVNDTIIMNGAWLWAMGSGGVPPYTFEWIAPNGDVFQGSDLLTADQEGEWCVVLTDFFGCTDTACVWVDLPGCWVDIAVVQDMGALWLEAVPAGTPPFTFAWSTGDTAQIIPYPVQSDVSVSVTDATGCTATSSVVTGTPQFDFGIEGWVYPADSVTWPIYIPGRAELWRWNDTDSLVLVDTVPLGMTLNTPHYDFGDQALGLYLVRIIPYDTTLLPTYHFHAHEWQQAWPIEIPVYGTSIGYSVYMLPATPLNGPGSIEGYVGAADGFRPGDEPESDEPLAGATLLLYDAAGEPLQWRATSATGHFRFDGLPWGTYELVLEIPGREQARQWITLGPDQPVVQVTFEVGNDGTTVTEAEEVATAAIVRLSPNPTSGLLRLEMTLPQAGPVELRIFDPTGRMLWQDRQMAPSGTQVWTIAGQHLPKGIYFLQVATETDMRTLRFVKQ